jgi:hypothetical protein
VIIKSWILRITFALFFVTVGALLSCAAFLFWLRNYPNADDPKNIDYVLWKHGLNENMNLDAALRAMTHDSSPVQRVAGLSDEELRRRFGYIRTPDSTSHIGGCYSAESLRHPRADKVVSLRDSLWTVTLENGRAVDIVLCKGS